MYHATAVQRVARFTITRYARSTLVKEAPLFSQDQQLFQGFLYSVYFLKLRAYLTLEGMDMAFGTP